MDKTGDFRPLVTLVLPHPCPAIGCSLCSSCWIVVSFFIQLQMASWLRRRRSYHQSLSMKPRWVFFLVYLTILRFWQRNSECYHRFWIASCYWCLPTLHFSSVEMQCRDQLCSLCSQINKIQSLTPNIGVVYRSVHVSEIPGPKSFTFSFLRIIIASCRLSTAASCCCKVSSRLVPFERVMKLFCGTREWAHLIDGQWIVFYEKLCAKCCSFLNLQHPHVMLFARSFGRCFGLICVMQAHVFLV